MVGLLATPLAARQDNRIDGITPAAPELAAPGPWAVGVTTLTAYDRHRVDILNTKPGGPTLRYDRPLTFEVWYPARLASGQQPGGSYRAITRDPAVVVTLRGRAVRDAAIATSGGRFPLVVISHGYPGHRLLMSHLGENLASKGYVVVSIDHADSTYADLKAFGSTLYNRALDQRFAIDEIASFAGGADTLFAGRVDVSRTAVIGYSMGGYGVVNTLGGGFSAAAVKLPMAPVNGVLARRQAGNPEYAATMDPRIKAAIAFAPWGWNTGFWDAAGLAGIKTPVFFVAGSVDDVSGYSPGVRNIFEASVNAPRYLLTYENANHNAGAPMPAPAETWTPVPHMPAVPAAHYLDPVWDSVRMNNIAQHFATAFLGKYLRGDAAMDAYLNLVEYSRDGKWSAEANGNLKSDHTFWKGFSRRNAAGLRLEFRKP